MVELTHASLFSGIGGFDLAARNCGIRNIFQVEINEFCQKVLKKNFPETIKYRDIKQFNGNDYYGTIDIISGGFPCQDFSIAGIRNKRKGLDGERSGLFFELIRVISQIKPKYVIWENSPQAIHAIKEINQSFKDIGYVSWQKKLSARKFGFPHKRERLYGVSFADSDSFGFNAFKTFNSEFEKIYKSKEILRMSKANQAQFSRTLSPSFRGIPDSKFIRNDDGLPRGLDSDRIKALGNAIVPQIAEQIFKAIIETEYRQELKCKPNPF